MNEFERDFAQDCREKKRTAAGSYHMKRGSKSHKCTLPSDHLTQAQWKRKNGEVMTYKMDAPCKISEFYTWPRDIQQEYIRHLRDLYQVTNKMLGQMWGVSGARIQQILVGLELTTGKTGPTTRKIRTERNAKWAAFCNGVIGGGSSSDLEQTATPGKPILDVVEPEEDQLIEDLPDEQIEKSFEPESFHSCCRKLTDRACGHYDYEALRSWATELIDKAESADIFGDKNVLVTFTIEEIG